MIRTLNLSDLSQALELHKDLLAEEFISTCGDKFLYHYYRTWMSTPYGVSIGAFEDNELVGLLLGSINPSLHYRYMLSNGGLLLAYDLGIHALKNSQFRRELIRTRLKRYLFAIGRVIKSSLLPKNRKSDTTLRTQAENNSHVRIGEITHLLVSNRSQGKGIGALLVNEMIARSTPLNLSKIVLVTPPQSKAKDFYSHIGFKEDTVLTNSSGETFLRMFLPLD